VTQYEKQPEYGDGRRLHLNENTAGCSPRVIEALRRLTAQDLGFYPDYSSVNRAAAKFLGVDEERLLLTNGLDEGLLAASIAYLQREPHNGAAGAPRNGDADSLAPGPDGDRKAVTDAASADTRPEAVIVEPAFGMYADCVGAVGGRAMFVEPGPELAFPLNATLAAITPSTRLVFLTSPGNPSGLAISREALRAVARRTSPDALVFLDEAYADFAEGNFLDELAQWPNVVIGRTFAKSYGLAGLRVGAVIGAADAIARLRRSLPPYTLNAVAAAILPVALDDQAYIDWYRQQVSASRALVYDACDRLGLTYWRSEANFVLLRVGARASDIVRQMAERRVFVRDRSTEPGCDGCIRVTTGVIEDTRAALTALEEILCVGA
jgi:histidinol-phosphate aminotransferase